MTLYKNMEMYKIEWTSVVFMNEPNGRQKLQLFELLILEKKLWFTQYEN